MPRKLLKFLILFDNSSLLYFPGQFLSGRVLLELQDETPALGLQFHVVGEGVVRIQGAHDRTDDREKYIDFKMRLLGGPSGEGPEVTVLSPGIHSFPFKLGLPYGLPSTFLGRFGWIQYYCKAALREPSGLIHKNHQVFIVMNSVDLHLEYPALSVSHLFVGTLFVEFQDVRIIKTLSFPSLSLSYLPETLYCRAEPQRFHKHLELPGTIQRRSRKQEQSPMQDHA